MADELAKRIRIPYEQLVLGRVLVKKIIPVRVSMEKPWLIDKRILKASLRIEVNSICLFFFLVELISLTLLL